MSDAKYLVLITVAWIFLAGSGVRAQTLTLVAQQRQLGPEANQGAINLMTTTNALTSTDADRDLIPLKLLADVSFEPGEGDLAPKLHFHNGKNIGKVTYDIDLQFQASDSSASAEEAADNFRLNGGTGSITIQGSYEADLGTVGSLQLSAAGGLSWLETKRADTSTEDDTSVDGLDTTMAQGDTSDGVLGASVGVGLVLLKSIYIGWHATYNDAFTGDLSDTAELLDNEFSQQVRVIVAAEDYYLQASFLTDSDSGDDFIIAVAREFHPF